MDGTSIPKHTRYQIIILGFLIILINTQFIQNASANLLFSSNQSDYTRNAAEDALATANDTLYQCFNLLTELELWGGDISEYTLQLNIATSNLTLAYNAYFANDYESTVTYALSAVSAVSPLLSSLQSEVTRQTWIQWINAFFLPILIGIIITSIIILLRQSVSQKRKMLNKQVHSLKIKRLILPSEKNSSYEKTRTEEEGIE